MKKVIIYFDEDKKCYQIITPFRQEGPNSKEVFDGNWQKLVEHVTRSYRGSDGSYVKNYYKYEVI